VVTRRIAKDGHKGSRSLVDWWWSFFRRNFDLVAQWRVEAIAGARWFFIRENLCNPWTKKINPKAHVLFLSSREIKIKLKTLAF